MKKISIIILLLLFTFIYSEETIPQLLIEGTEIEDINIENTGNVKVKLKNIDDNHEKQILDKKGNTIPKKIKNQYKFEFDFGNNIYTKANFQGNIFLKKINIFPVFSYYHNYPYIRNNYFESFLGGVKGKYKSNRLNIGLDTNENYKIYQYANKKFIKRNLFNTKLSGDFYPNSDLFLSYSFEFLKMNNSDVNIAKEINDFKNIFFGKLYLDNLLIRFKADWDTFVHNAPTYYIYIMGAYSCNKFNAFLGVSGYKQIEKGIYPLLGLSYLVLKHTKIFLKTDIEKVNENEIKLSPLLNTRKDLYNLKKSAQLGVEFSKDIFLSNLSLVYNENLNYPAICFNEPIYDETGTHNYPVFLKSEFSIISKWILKFSYYYNYNKDNYIPLNKGILFLYIPWKKFDFTGSLTYNDITKIDNAALRADLLYHFTLSYKFRRTFSFGAGIVKNKVNTDNNANTNYYIFIKGIL